MVRRGDAAHVRALDGAGRTSGWPAPTCAASSCPATTTRPASTRAIERRDRRRGLRRAASSSLASGYTMISLGYSNRTPFDSPRELDEDELFRRVEALAEQVERPLGTACSTCTCRRTPPQLDTAPELDDDLNVVLAAGSRRWRRAARPRCARLIERFQPLRRPCTATSTSRAGRRGSAAPCAINPGSDYHTGRISGVLVHLRRRPRRLPVRRRLSDGDDGDDRAPDADRARPRRRGAAPARP